MITIDGKNIYTEWTLATVYDNYLNQLMKFPDIKDRITNDWSDENGIEVLYETAKQKSREVVLSFFCETFQNYELFMNYLVANPVVTLSDDTTNKKYLLEYMACSSFNYYRKYNMFAVKMREADPTNRPV